MAQDERTVAFLTEDWVPQPAADIEATPQRMTYTELLDNSPMHGMLWLIFFGCTIAQLLDGFAYETTTFALPLILKEFHITATKAGALGSFTNLGLLFGALTFGPLSDRFGRKSLFQCALLLFALGTLLSSIAPSYQWLLAARFVAGLGIAAQFPVAFALLAEYAPKRIRHIFVGAGAVAYSTGWLVCGIVSTFLVPKFGWRALYMVGGILPAFMIFFVRRYIPESIRFLLHQGRIPEANRIARKLAKDIGLENVELVAPVQTFETRPTLAKQFVVFRVFLVTALILGVFQLTNNVQIVGIGTWLPSIFIRQGFTLTKSFAFTMTVLTVTPLGAIFGTILQGKMPRKWAMLLLAFLSAMCFLGVGLAFEHRYPIAVILGFNMCYQFCSGGIVPIVYTLNAELFPTSVRSLASGLSIAFARIGSIAGPLILGILMTSGAQIHTIIYYFAMPLLIASVITALFLKVDSRNRSLEEVTGE